MRYIGVNELREMRANAWENAKNFLDTHSDEKGMLSAADRRARAIGRSKREPLFGISAGDRLMVMRLPGRKTPVLRNALRTRSCASRTWADKKPTILNCGSPSVISASTVIGWT